MKIKLYQIAPERDDKNLMFMNYEWTVKHGGVHSGPLSICILPFCFIKRR